MTTNILGLDEEREIGQPVIWYDLFSSSRTHVVTHNRIHKEFENVLLAKVNIVINQFLVTNVYILATSLG